MGKNQHARDTERESVAAGSMLVMQRGGTSLARSLPFPQFGEHLAPVLQSRFELSLHPDGCTSFHPIVNSFHHKLLFQKVQACDAEPFIFHICALQGKILSSHLFPNVD